MARKLGQEEKALWGRVMATVKPLHIISPKATIAPPIAIKHSAKKSDFAAALAQSAMQSVAQSKRLAKDIMPAPIAPIPLNATLDGTWDRKIGRGAIVPDVHIDLHGSTMNSAYARLDGALEQAIAHHMRVILLVTGRARSHDRASGQGRGAIASVVRDWLAASRHAGSISAVRAAHPRHGGAGALYIVLKR